MADEFKKRIEALKLDEETEKSYRFDSGKWKGISLFSMLFKR
jgi:hypothetical protein